MLIELDTNEQVVQFECAQTAMVQSIKTNNPEQFALALKHGADSFLYGDKRFREARSPFHNAAMKGYTDMVHLVLKTIPGVVDAREPQFQKNGPTLRCHTRTRRPCQTTSPLRG